MRRPSSSARELAGSTSESTSFSSTSGSDSELQALRLRGSSGSKGETGTSLPDDVSSPSIIELASDGEDSGSELAGGKSNGRLEGPPPGVAAPSSPSVVDIVSDGEGRLVDLVAKTGAENGTAAQPQQKTTTAAANTSTTLLLLPAGVKVVSDDLELDANAEVKRLLRQPRYFDPEFEKSGPRCFKCGMVGHLARECPNPAQPKPCYVCASTDHAAWDCPRVLCFKCRRPGHKARDCPKDARGPSSPAPKAKRSEEPDDAAPTVCIRCGREDCDGVRDPQYARTGLGCTREYLSDDVRNVRCATCGRCGHLSCAPAPMTKVRPTCYLCAEEGHLGDDCPWDHRNKQRRPSSAMRQRSYSDVSTEPPYDRHWAYDSQRYSSSRSRRSEYDDDSRYRKRSKLSWW